MNAIVSDFTVLSLEADSQAPGVFLFARKPERWAPADLSPIALYSVMKRRRAADVSGFDVVLFKNRYRLHMLYRVALPHPARARVKRLVAHLTRGST